MSQSSVRSNDSNFPFNLPHELLTLCFESASEFALHVHPPRSVSSWRYTTRGGEIVCLGITISWLGILQCERRIRAAGFLSFSLGTVSVSSAGKKCMPRNALERGRKIESLRWQILEIIAELVAEEWNRGIRITSSFSLRLVI